MLSHEENDYLCRVGPGTPMGAALRRYWIPACLSADLPEADSDPVRIRRVGENFIAFRDTNGVVGILDEQCCHRGASLAFGRVEECGIRCLYHGWKYAVDGTILETPNMADSRYRQAIKAPAYPVCEVGDVVWVYLGPPELIPPEPAFNWTGVPSANRFVFEMIQENCNFVQALEGGLDSSHVGILHSDEVKIIQAGGYDPTGIGRDRYPSTDAAPRLEVEDTSFGFHYAAIRDGDEPETSYVRITPYVIPFMTYPPGNVAVMRVPIDDDATAVISAIWDEHTPPDREYALARHGMNRPEVYGEDKVLRIERQDRQAMRRRESWSGIFGFNPQDGAMTMNMGGPIYDRTREHLVPADYAIIRMRRTLIDAARAVEDGKEPVGISLDLDARGITCGSGLIAEDARWQDLVPGNRPSLERSGG
jgi:phthalate 4,5-dioxygenase oxygenase subunit